MDAALYELFEQGEAQDEIAAVIRLGQLDQVPAGVRVVTQFGEIATCRLQRGAIPEVRADEAIASFKAPRVLLPDPDVPIEEALPLDPLASDQRRSTTLEPTGKGVVIGVVDWGFDFAHPDFLNEDGSTRILALWDQRSRPGVAPPEPYGYGIVHTEAAINQALKSPDPYAALGYHPADADPTGDGSHATHVASIAGGNGRSGGPIGIAPQAKFVFVHMSTLNAPGQEKLGDSVTLIEAIDFIAKTAQSCPWVINLSMGRHGEQHDGTTLVEQALDAALREAPGRAICLSTGNYYDRRIHTSGQLRPGDRCSFVWEIKVTDRTPNQLEVWYSGRDTLEIQLRSPSSKVSPAVALGERKRFLVNGQEVGRIYHRAIEPNNLDNHITIFLYPNAPTGRWKITLIPKDVVDGRFHSWIERDAVASHQSHFPLEDTVSTYTTGTICNGYRTIAAGAYNPHSPDLELGRFSSAGPTRNDRIKPDLVAPGVAILAARSTSREGDSPLVVRKSGTSMAAPHVTGTIALMFEAAPRPLRIEETHNLLLGNTRKVAVSEEDQYRIGSGYLDIEAAVEAASTVSERFPTLKPKAKGEGTMHHEPSQLNPQTMAQSQETEGVIFQSKPGQVVPQAALKLKINEQYRFILPEATSAGFSWSYEIEGTQGVIDIQAESLAGVPNALLDGDSGYRLFTITALTPGDVKVAFTYKRPWEKDKPPQKQETLEIVVRRETLQMVQKEQESQTLVAEAMEIAGAQNRRVSDREQSEDEAPYLIESDVLDTNDAALDRTFEVDEDFQELNWCGGGEINDQEDIEADVSDTDDAALDQEVDTSETIEDLTELNWCGGSEMNIQDDVEVNTNTNELGQNTTPGKTKTHYGCGDIEDEARNEDTEGQNDESNHQLLESIDDSSIDENRAEWNDESNHQLIKLVDVADEAITNGKINGSAGALVQYVFSEAGIAESISPTKDRFPSPAALFDAFAYPNRPALQQHYSQFFEVVAAPGMPLSQFPRSGDLLVRRTYPGHPGHVAMLAASELWSPEQAIEAGLQLESLHPGWYAQVVEGGALPHTRSQSFVRRVANSQGVMPTDQLILRPIQPAIEADSSPRSGDRNSRDYIRWVQSALNQVLGLQLTVDGIAGAQTRTAIRQFQQQQGLVADSVVGSRTEQALIAAGVVPPFSNPTPTPQVKPAGEPDYSVPCPNPPTILDRFNYDQSKLLSQHYPIIDSIAARIVASYDTDRPVHAVCFTGHADNTGAPQYNLALGKKRAEEVRKALIAAIERLRPGLSKQINFPSAYTMSEGDTSPVAPNNTEDGRSRNRRVAIYLNQNWISNNPPTQSPTVRIDLVEPKSLTQSSEMLAETDVVITSDPTIVVMVGQSVEVVATGKPTPGTYTWSSGDSAIAEIDFASGNTSSTHPNKAKITGKTIGTTKITITYTTASGTTQAKKDVVVANIKAIKIDNSPTAPVASPKRNEFIRPRMLQPEGVAYQVLQVQFEPANFWSGKSAQWTFTPDGTVRGTLPTKHNKNLEAATGFNFTATNKRSAINSDGIAAVRINVPPISFNRAKVSIAATSFSKITTSVLFEVPGVVVIDPGHGGTTNLDGSSSNNATSVSGVLEKMMTLEMAKQVRQALQTNTVGKVYVLLTRENDVNIEGVARANVAKCAAADVLLSIHFNGNSDPTVRGTEAFVRANSNGNVNRDQDRALAQRVLDAALGAIPSSRDRGVKDDTQTNPGKLAVLSDTVVGNTASFHPIRSCLIELEFITNPTVDALFNTGKNAATFRQTLGTAISNAIVEDLSKQP